MTSEAEERQARALELRMAGATYDAIAKAVRYASRSGAYKAVQAALREGRLDDADVAVETELARLDAMLTGLWPKARRGDVQAVDRVLRIGERRSALLSIASRASTDQQEVDAVDDLASRRAARQTGTAAK